MFATRSSSAPSPPWGGSAGKGRLRETLQWDEATYEAVKAELLGLRQRQQLRSGLFRAIDDRLRKQAGCGTELDDTEQTSWLLCLDDRNRLEADRAAVALLEGRTPTPILAEAYRWTSWAAPKDASGQISKDA